jgi:CDGSH-type Zn-finger protein
MKMADIKITISDNGPLLVTGPVPLLDARGNPVEGASDKMALCRCGGSSNKPFCDGTHREIGFSGT